MGCGPGFFSVEMAKMLSGSGKVIAADLQQGMLDKVKQKIKGTELEQRIVLHKCQEESIDVTEKVDFVLAFYMVHEVPDRSRFFKEIKTILKPDGLIFIIEPKFHVSKKSFENMILELKNIELVITERPKVFFSRTIVLANKVK